MAKVGRPKKHFVGRTNFTVRLDVPLRDRIRACSTASGRSMSEEIARRVERSFLQDDLVAAVREEMAKIKLAHHPVINGTGLSKDEVSAIVQRSQKDFARHLSDACPNR